MGVHLGFFSKFKDAEREQVEECMTELWEAHGGSPIAHANNKQAIATSDSARHVSFPK